jgi:signal transduction histidine kinase
MTNATIRFASDILRRLGEELNPGLDQGIVELVKNAYDADAHDCTVSLTGVDEPGGEVIVSDDGIGMTAEEIVSSWLILGRSSKNPTERTARGRVPAGSKGLGRLAALRMGKEAVLTTRPVAEPELEHELRIDWRLYDDVSVVDEVALDIESRPRLPGEGRGTDVRVKNLSRPLRHNEVRNLARALVLLGDPFGDDPTAFRPRLLAPEFTDLEGLVQNRYFLDADYHLTAEIQTDGSAKAQVLDWRGEVLWQATHAEISADPSHRPYNCPPVRFDLWAYLLSREAFATRSVSLGEVRTWLGHFGGVHLYVNGIRVAPYGNAGNDWLELNLERARDPEERPSTNNSIGRFAIDDPQGALVQKTDRSGFIEDVGFEELKRFGKDALDWMARRRLDVAEKRRRTERTVAPSTTSKARQGVEQQIEMASESDREALGTAFARYEKAREREVNVLRREVQLYRTLSTAGITAATFAHEASGNPLKVLTHAVNAIERRAKQELGGNLNGLAAPLKTLRRAIDSLSSLGSTTLRLLAPDKRRVGRVDLNRIVREVVDTYKPMIEARGITLTAVYGPGTPYLRGSEAAVESIITNLLNNSVVASAAGNGRGAAQILVETDLEGDRFRLRVADTGPGVVGISLSDIWLPGETTRDDGTGLGLSIVRDAAIDLGGRADAIATGELGGAEFFVELPTLGH